MNHIALLIVPIMWWRKPCEGLDGHGTSPSGRCEGSPEPREVSSLGKLRVFSKSLIGTLGMSFITVLEMLLRFDYHYKYSIINRYVILFNHGKRKMHYSRTEVAVAARQWPTKL